MLLAVGFFFLFCNHILNYQEWCATGWPFRSCPEKKVQMNTGTVFVRMVQGTITPSSYPFRVVYASVLLGSLLELAAQVKADAVVIERAAKLPLCRDLALAADARAWSNLFWSHAVKRFCHAACGIAISGERKLIKFWSTFGRTVENWRKILNWYENTELNMALVGLFLCPPLNQYLNMNVCFKPY